MIEIVYERVRRGAVAWAAPARRLHPGWCAVALVLVVVAGRYLWVGASRVSQREEIASAFGSGWTLYGCAQMDAAGNRLCYARQIKVGRAVFVLDLRTGEKQQVGKVEGGFAPYAWPWAPDDRKFVYSIGETLFVWPPTSVLSREGLKLGDGIQKRVSDLVWLGTNRFVCVLNQKRVCHIRESQGELELLADYQPAGGNGSIASLNAVGTNAVAWVNGNQIWRLELAGAATSEGAGTLPAVWLDPKRSDVGELAVCPLTGQVLFSCAGEQGGRQLWRWEPARGAGSVVLVLEAAGIAQTRWVGRDRYAFVTRKSGENCLALAGGGAEAAILPFSSVSLVNAAPDGKRLLVTAIGGKDIALGIWEYECVAETLKCLVPGTDRPSPAAVGVVPHRGSFAGPAGTKDSFSIVRPVGFDPHSGRKYPVVIGNTAGERPPWVDALANCGCFVVILDRDSWFGGIEKWGERIMALYPKLAENPAMDLGQAYLFGQSAETRYLSQLAVQRPELWKGVILLNPGGLPELSAFPPGRPVPNVLINFGETEGQERFKRYQEEAARRGISVQVVMHKNLGHFVIQSGEAMLERTRSIIRFVSDDPL